MIDIAKIKIDSKAQSRMKLCKATIDEYAEAYKEGVKFPPVTLFYDGESYWLADGFHRYFGAKHAKIKQIQEDVTPGTLRDAILFSVGANANHGLRRSIADRRKAVRTLLDDPEWTKLSNREIAKHCNVSHPTVSAERNRGVVNLPLSDAKKPTETSGKSGVKQEEKPADTDDSETGEGGKFTTNEQSEEPEYTELDQAHEQIAELQNALSVAAKGELGDEEKAEALSLVDGLRAEIKTLEASLRAVTASRNLLQQENKELKTQIRMQRKEIDKLAGTKTA